MSTIPHEVQEAARKHGELQRQNQIDLDAIKGVDEDAPTRAAAALALRIDGAGWSDIARVLDYSSAQRARKAVERVLADEAASVEQIEHVRWLNARRLEKILNSLMKRATNPKDPDHLQYARMAVVVIDQHSKLYGANAPQKMNVQVTPAQVELERWVMQMAQQVAADQQEADIIDAEIVDDTEESK